MTELTGSISNTKIKVRWTEPYVSEAVNKQNGSTPPGVYEGGLVDYSSSTNLRVNGGTFVVFDTTNGFGMHLIDPDNTIIDCSSLFPVSGNQTFYVGVRIVYATGNPTTGEYYITDVAPSEGHYVGRDALVLYQLDLHDSDAGFADVTFNSLIESGARPIPYPTRASEGSVLSTDRRHGLLTNVQAYNLPTLAQKNGLDGSVLPTIDNHYVTVEDTPGSVPHFYKRILPNVDEAKTKLDVGAATNIWYSMSSAVINGVRKLIVTNFSLNATLEIYDCETMTLDGNTGELPGLPDVSPYNWNALHVMCDDQYAYVYFVSLDVSGVPIQMQCYDFETWTVRSGWPSTGVVVTAGMGTFYAGGPMAHIDEDTFAFCTYLTVSASTTAAVKVINKADGSIVGQGAGDAPAGTYTKIMGICCDGNYIYGFTSDGYVCSIDPSSPSSGCGGSGWPLEIGNNGIRDIACGGGLVVTVGDDNTKRLINVATPDNANIGRVYSGDLSKLKALGRLVYDGSVFWALGTREYDINRHILAAGAAGPYVSNNYGKNWVEISDGFGTFYDMVLYSSGIVVAAGSSGRIHRSTDFGFTWTEEADTLSGDVTSIIGWSNGYMAAGDETGDIHQSTDYGDSWSEVESALDSHILCMAAFSGGIGLAGTGNSGKIFRSTDYGANWTEEADTTESYINCIATFSNGYAVAGTYSGGRIFQSTDYGDSWSEVEDTSETSITAIATLDDGQAIACSDGDGKIFRSTNYGTDWEQVWTTGDSNLKAALMLSNGIALISSINKIYRSTDFGITWEVVSMYGLSTNTIKVFDGVTVVDRYSLYKLNVRGIVNHSDNMPAIELNGENIVEPFSFNYNDVHPHTTDVSQAPMHFDGRDIWTAPEFYDADEIFRLMKVKFL
jgi:photosystem II stability/assembly factor-like uncharacterized protein